MWFALTAHQKKRSKKEIQKEFFAGKYGVIMTAESRDELEKKLNESIVKFPREMEKYLHAGIKIIEADSSIRAKLKAAKENKYFDQSGQYSLF